VLSIILFQGLAAAIALVFLRTPAHGRG
jgi:hypothetical protein